jgi:fructose 1,6-bisphosphatase
MKVTLSVLKADIGSIGGHIKGMEPAMLPYSELEYGGVVEKLAKLEKKFTIGD